MRDGTGLDTTRHDGVPKFRLNVNVAVESPKVRDESRVAHHSVKSWLCTILFGTLLRFQTFPYLIDKRRRQIITALPRLILIITALNKITLDKHPGLGTTLSSALWSIYYLPSFLGFLVTTLVYFICYSSHLKIWPSDDHFC